MKMRHSVKWMLVGALAMPSLTACSFGGGDEEAEEVEASDEGNAANAEGEEGNETAAVEGAEGTNANAAGTEGNVAFDENGGNAAAAVGGVASNDIPPELLNSENPTAPAGAEAAGMGETAAMGAEGNLPTSAAPEATPATDAAAPAATDAVAAAHAAAAPVEVASGDARVYYVSTESASLHNGPSASAASVGSLKKGDPVLVRIEGAWANVLNRGFVEVASLSQAPVGRSSAPAKTWH
ncbi:MAG: hypothetical protein H7318_08955 [Oligoflexus sp.]|nr:hypothetical protein [Oligoflexus sp.]